MRAKYNVYNVTLQTMKSYFLEKILRRSARGGYYFLCLGRTKQNFLSRSKHGHATAGGLHLPKKCLTKFFENSKFNININNIRVNKIQNLCLSADVWE